MARERGARVSPPHPRPRRESINHVQHRMIPDERCAMTIFRWGAIGGRGATGAPKARKGLPKVLAEVAACERMRKGKH